MSYPKIPIQDNPYLPSAPPLTKSASILLKCGCSVAYEDRKKPCIKHNDKKKLIELTLDEERGAEKIVPDELIKYNEFKACARKYFNVKDIYNSESDKVEVFIIQKNKFVKRKSNWIKIDENKIQEYTSYMVSEQGTTDMELCVKQHGKAVKVLTNKEYREGLRKQNGQLNISSIYKKITKRGLLIGTGTVIAFFLNPVLGAFTAFSGGVYENTKK